ncbi:extracellular solute-binding protein [Spirochaetota bacterium]
MRSSLKRIILTIVIIMSFTVISCSRKSQYNINYYEIKDPKTAGELADYEKLKRDTPYTIYGSPDAIKGGTINIGMEQFPKSLNYLVNNEVTTSMIYYKLYESLLIVDETTLDFIPCLAEKYEVSEDKLDFKFYIDKRARWADGKNVTVHDVIFTYNTIMNPSNLTAVQRVGLSKFHPPQAIDDYTVVFKAKKTHWRNLLEAGLQSIIPEHLYKGKNFNKAFNYKLPPGSGPYTITKLVNSQYITLERRKDYWAEKLPWNFGRNNFNKIKFKSFMTQDQILSHIKKGSLDVMKVTTDYWYNDLNILAVEKNWLRKKKVINFQARGIYGMCLNTRRKVLSDSRVRKALQYALNRKEMIDKLLFGEPIPHNTYWPYLFEGNDYNEKIKYDIKKSRQLLNDAGWVSTDKEGFLVKDGLWLEFEVIYGSDRHEKYLTIFKEDLKNIGIKLNLNLVSGSVWGKKLDEFDFDGVMIGWYGSIFSDPTQLWHSKEADVKQGNNYPGLKIKSIDMIITNFAMAYKHQKRVQMLKEADKILYKKHPYILFWGSPEQKIAYWDKFGKPPTYYSKYGRESEVLSYWWYDPQKADKLKKAVKNNESLPNEEENIFYNDKIKDIYYKR